MTKNIKDLSVNELLYQQGRLKYHIASTVAILFLIQSFLILILPFKAIGGYSILLFILFAYVAMRNKIKLVQADKEMEDT